MVKPEYKQFLLSITSLDVSTEELGKLAVNLRGRWYDLRALLLSSLSLGHFRTIRLGYGWNTWQRHVGFDGEKRDDKMMRCVLRLIRCLCSSPSPESSILALISTMSFPVDGQYVISNSVRSLTGEKLAITFQGAGQPATVENFVSGNTFQIVCSPPSLPSLCLFSHY